MPSSEIYHEEQGTNHGNPADGLSGSDGPVREPHHPYVRRKGGPAVDLRMISCNDGFRPFSFYIEVF